MILFRHIQNADPMRQVLLTFGLIYIGLDAVRLIWGTMSHSISAPDLLSNSIMLINEPYPSYRLFVIFVGFNDDTLESSYNRHCLELTLPAEV